ncbi:hypothetical protein [Desulfovibrio sp. TomC]|uniref:hypothetical protein n=1 Tax=Desulfovibrio sp. TomC TaxID=1562888 RepID=UPI000574D932|nr:hypothetical protein [Desulfovibrio sp. TomC]KHK03869.1 hypothetical protein NY78_0925 [Desulfovibrio sp. TomC]
MKTLVILVVLGLPGFAWAAGDIAVTPQMRQAMQDKMHAQCLAKEGEFARQGYTKPQIAAICKCATQQTAALLNSRTVNYILTHGSMPEEMERKVASATEGCIRSSTMIRK